MVRISPSTSNANPSLARLGFLNDPFATYEAEQERDILNNGLFVEAENFDRIKAAHTLIVYAPRGCGKTAYRVYLANEAAPRKTAGIVEDFAIELINFDAMIAKCRRGEELQAEDFVQEIMRLGAEELFTYLFKSPEGVPRLNALPISHLSRLAKLIWAYAPNLLAPESIFEKFGLSESLEKIHWADFRQAVRNRHFHDFISASISRADPRLDSIGFLVDIDLEDRRIQPSSLLSQVNLLREILQELGFHQLVILLDRIDETETTKNNPSLQARLLAPLLNHLQLIEAPGLSFKFFIPDDTRQALIDQDIVRTDRLEIVTLTLHWEEKGLRSLLKRRLDYFGVKDFSLMFSSRRGDQAGDGKTLDRSIEDAMIEFAQGSPRWLILAGRALLDAYQSRDNADLIIWKDWQKAKEELARRRPPKNKEEENKDVISQPNAREVQSKPEIYDEGIPILYISRDRPEIQIMGKTAFLTENEFRLIHMLIDKGGTCHQDVIADEIWDTGKGISDSGIDVTLMRVRKKINELVTGLYEAKEYYLQKRAKHIMLRNYLVE